MYVCMFVYGLILTFELIDRGIKLSCLSLFIQGFWFDLVLVLVLALVCRGHHHLTCILIPIPIPILNLILVLVPRALLPCQ